jgi:UDP-N-acetylglucosamine 4,6-dehydratase/5-epimerase
MNILQNKNVLITGGTGSFGKTFLKQCLKSNINKVRIFSRDENKQDNLRRQISDERLQCFIGDVRDPFSVSAACDGIDYVFHAAALKQVPSCEFYPLEAMKTNVIGTENILNAARDNKVKKVVLLSTDKAVYPINAMGITKALAEKITISRSLFEKNCETVVCATRYGNVMASRGSVIPLFVSQIKNKQAITITDPNMTRFLMSLDQSVDLVLEALTNAQMGDIYVQKAPAATVHDLAFALKEIFGSDNSIEIIGTRHGEKLYETLISREEMARVQSRGNYYRIPSDKRDLNYDNYFTDGETEITASDDYTSHNTTRLSTKEIIEELLQLDFIKRQLDV